MAAPAPVCLPLDVWLNDVAKLHGERFASVTDFVNRTENFYAAAAIRVNHHYFVKELADLYGVRWDEGHAFLSIRSFGLGGQHRSQWRT